MVGVVVGFADGSGTEGDLMLDETAGGAIDEVALTGPTGVPSDEDGCVVGNGDLTFGEYTDEDNGEMGLDVVVGGGILGESSTRLRCCFALARSAIQEG